MHGQPFLWDCLPSHVQEEADRLATLHERSVQISSDKLRMRLLLAASHANGDPFAAMHAVLKERRAELARWKKQLLEDRQSH